MCFFSGLIQKIQKERQEKQEKEEEEKKKEKQRQEAEEMVRKMHEGADSLGAATTDQGETKVSGEDSAPATQVPEVVGETVEVEADASSTATTNNDKTNTKNSTSTSSSEDVDEETAEGEEKIGKDGISYLFFFSVKLLLFSARAHFYRAV